MHLSFENFSWANSKKAIRFCIFSCAKDQMLALKQITILLSLHVLGNSVVELKPVTLVVVRCISIPRNL
ncbi:unnamed protein product [Allacma fusca]|uniref:Uncharacterized protein n=1 Tax=Allacma fusca TaxID=39272 RepID=A0A8J2NTI7_9HEXA|nr:unnamed protein product [Allacma fusca]